MLRRCCATKRTSFVPLAIDGLAQDVLGRRFALKATRGWRRLPARGRGAFPGDSDLPDLTMA